MTTRKGSEMDGTMTWTAEFDLTPEQAAGLAKLAPQGEYRRYRNVVADFDLWIEKLDGAFRTTVIAPGYTMQRDATAATLLAWIDGGWINLDAPTLADLRAWALGEVGA